MSEETYILVLFILISSVLLCTLLTILSYNEENTFYLYCFLLWCILVVVLGITEKHLSSETLETHGKNQKRKGKNPMITKQCGRVFHYLKVQAQRFAYNNIGASIMDKIVGLAIGIMVLAALMPTAISNLTDANTTGWDADVVTVWDNLPIIAIIGIFVVLITYALGRRKGGL